MESTNTAEIKVDLDGWVSKIKEGLDIEDDEEVKELCISVFNVPKELLVVKPEAFIPQTVSIGPYHQWRPELYATERYKLAAARRFQKRSGLKFDTVVDEVRQYEWQIRSCYHKYLDYNEEALAWFMALSASFLLECLQFYVQKTEETSSEVSYDAKQLGKALDPTGRSATHNAIVRDLMMLENQIPLFLLQKLLEIQLGCQEKAEERLCTLVRLACVELSPFKFKVPDNSKLRIQEKAHILEVLYYSIVTLIPDDELIGKVDESEQQPSSSPTYLKSTLSSLWKAFSSLNVGPVRRVVNGRGFQLVMKIPLLVLSTLRNLRATKEKNEAEQSFVNIPPARDELAIPSVADLHSAGIKFLPTDGDLTTIRFDQATATLYLPKVELDANSEVLLRNLVAFEASLTPGALIFARYTDFVNGIIDKEEDVRLLRKSGIIYNHLESDKKVASLWNGMGGCVKLTRVRYLDQVISDIHTHYSRRWKVAIMLCVNKYIFRSWKVLSLLAVAILLLLTCLEEFCNVYDCRNQLSHARFSEDEG